MDETTLKNLSEQAQAVAGEQEDLDRAIDEERTAEAAVLERVIEAIRPGLRALSGRIRTAVDRRHHADVNYHGGTTEEEYDPRCGIRVAGSGPEEDCPRANAGSYEGCDLYLLSDGSFLELTYEGSWSRWQGSSWGWTSVATILSPREVMDEYALDPIVQTISAAVSKAATSEGRAKRSAAAKERAEKLRALTTLL